MKNQFSTNASGPVISPGNADMLTGEMTQFSTLGGTGVSTYSANNTGFIDALSGLYTVPLGTSPQNDFVTATDSASRSSALATVKIRAFENLFTFTPLTTHSVAQAFSATPAEFAGDLYYSGTANDSLSVIYKSSDVGANWTKVSELNFLQGTKKSGQLYADGPSLFYVGHFYRTDSVNNKGLFVFESPDGINWSQKQMSQQMPYEFFAARGFVKTNNGNFLIPAIWSDLTGSKIAIIKCNSDWSICTNTHEFATTNSDSSISTVKKDAAGNIYSSQIYGPSLFTKELKIKKSSDHGETWSDLYTELFSGSMSDLSVSSDGQTIVVVGTSGAVTPTTRFSNDGGSTWSTAHGVNACDGWFMDSVVVRANGDALATCFKFAAGNTQKIQSKAKLAGVWTTVFTNTGGSTGGLIELANTDILYSEITIGSLFRSTDFGTTWPARTFPSLTYPLVNSSAKFQSIMKSSTQDLYAVGKIGTGATTHDAAVYRSLDNGQSWTENYTYSNSNASFSSIVQSPTTSTLISVGELTTTRALTIHRSTTNGNSWSLVENYLPGGRNGFTTAKVVADSNGIFYVLGSYNNIGDSKRYSYVRSSNDDGLTWADFNSYIFPAGFNSEILGGVLFGTTLYTAGYAFENTNLISLWTIRKYDGLVWSIEDQDNLSSLTTTGGRAHDVLQSSDGTLWAIGYYNLNSLTKRWLVRKKPPGGVWTTVDDFSLHPNLPSVAYSLTEDSSQRILVSGIAVDTDSQQYAVVRSYRNGQWRTVEKFSNSTETESKHLYPCFANRICQILNYKNSFGLFLGLIRIVSE